MVKGHQPFQVGDVVRCIRAAGPSPGSNMGCPAKVGDSFVVDRIFAEDGHWHIHFAVFDDPYVYFPTTAFRYVCPARNT